MTAPGTAREQRLVFGEDPELYHRARHGYAGELVGAVLAYAGGRPPCRRAVEVGAGTGKATVAFAARGLEIVAVEPDAAMAAVAARNVGPYPAVSIVRSAFEDWPGEPHAFDLLFSAQAWHWVRPEVRDTKAVALLRRGGAVALFWHRVRSPEDDPLRQDLHDAYRRHAPRLHERRPGFPGFTPPGFESEMHETLSACPLYGDVEVRRYPWTATYSADGYVALLRTQSDHRLLPDMERAPLLDAVGRVVARHAGADGLVAVPYETYLLLARTVVT